MSGERLPGWPAALSVPLAAAYLSVSERVIWQLLHDGEIPGIARGARRLIRRDDLDTWLAQQAAAVTLPAHGGKDNRYGDALSPRLARARARRPDGSDGEDR